jgi:hypothetical protein
MISYHMCIVAGKQGITYEFYYKLKGNIKIKYMYPHGWHIGLMHL